MSTGRAGARIAAVASAGRGPHWEHLDAGGDVGVRGIGATKAAAFEQAGLALTAVIADPAAVEPRDSVEIECEGADDESLLVAWLDALIAEMNARRMLFSRFHVELHPRRIVATVGGECVSVEHWHAAAAVKRATFDQLRVARLATGEWLAQTVVDV
jgi:SHS2 domain-containing protein